jgi:hypothetical protein
VRLQTVVDYKKFENSRYCIYSHDVCRTNYCCTVTVATAPTLVMPDNGGYSTKNVTLYWSAPTSWGETCANPKRYDVWLRAVDKNGVQVMAWTLKASNLPETTTQYSFVGTTGLRDCLIYSKRAQIALLINKVRRAEALPQFVEVR